jgi:hypothetical protein
MTGGISAACGQSAPATTPAPATPDGRIDQLEKENSTLKKRLDALETMAQKEGILCADPASGAVKAMSETTLSGFVTSSYFYDTSKPPGNVSPGYLWNRNSGSFDLNKVKITLASPAVERSGDKWDAAYRISMIWGQDAPIVDSKAGTIGFQGLREAYVELNAPLGDGLNIRAGELISLLNYESGDGGAVNDNFSQGYQWFFTGNGPAAGVQLGYTFTDWLDVKVRAQNGLYAGPIDNNQSPTGLISIGIKPSEKSWISLVGFGGREDSFATHVAGGSFLGGWSVTDQFHLGTELDYFSFRTAAKDSGVYSAGAWLSYSITDKVMPAIRAEFLSDSHGADVSGGLGFPVGGQDLSSIALTLNLKPVPSIKIQPEVRFDHTSLPGGFGTKKDRVIVGAGVSYLF